MSTRIVGLIAGRELRDLLRDRRSVIMLFLLPIFLYPGFGLVGYWFAVQSLEQKSIIGVVHLSDLAAAAPPIVAGETFAPDLFDITGRPEQFRLVPLETDDRTPLERKTVDVMLLVPAGFAKQLTADETPRLEILNRDGDETSKLATRRLLAVLRKYDELLKHARFARRGLPDDFDKAIRVREPKDSESIVQRTSDELRDLLAKYLPFMLIMWALAGSLHPAIDLCAGEKERGTMETLLISPAERIEIVAGKFAAVWTFATATAWWNMMWMAGLCLLGSWSFESDFARPAGLAWCFILVLPITALFSALCIALGVYARSTKEGQYYLLPLFLGALPLVMASLAPGADLTFGLSVVPVTGVCLLIQKMIGPTPWSDILPYIAPVLLSLAACVALSLWWAARQFHREDVLFRQVEGSALRRALADIGANKINS